MLQDSHIHIQDIKSSETIRSFLNASSAQGPVRFFNCAITPSDWPLIRSLAQEYQAVVPFFGFHPWFADLADDASFRTLEEFLSWPRALAGEMGLDKARKNIDFSLQIDVFTRQLILARKCHKPFVVHCVRAWNDALTAIRAHAAGLPFILHSFNGSNEIAQEAASLGGYFSVSVRQFEREDKDFQDMFRTFPAERILMESDFPYQLKWSSAENYLTALKSAYEKGAALRQDQVERFIQQVYNNGTVFTHTVAPGV